MKKNKKYIIPFVLIIIVIVIVTTLLIWSKNKDINNNTPSSSLVDVGDVNNVPAVDEKLGDTMKITQGYLLKYTRNKSSIWYMSSAKINKIDIDGDNATVTLTNENNDKSLKGYINADKISVKKGDIINFVGTIDLSTGDINLSRISKEIIDYNSVTKLEFNELVDNINAVLSNKFVVSGYMVTDKDRYLLYESKTIYKNDSKVGNYFTLIWKDTFMYTGNADVTVMCNIGDTFVLKECELMEQ